MATNVFRAIALTLQAWIPDNYSLIQASDDIVSLFDDLITDTPVQLPVVKSPDGHAVYHWDTGTWVYNHDYLVSRCLDNDVVLMYVRQNQKIKAIKELRRVVPGAGLKACKEAVEDSLVGAKAELLSNPWGP